MATVKIFVVVTKFSLHIMLLYSMRGGKGEEYRKRGRMYIYQEIPRPTEAEVR